MELVTKCGNCGKDIRRKFRSRYIGKTVFFCSARCAMKICGERQRNLKGKENHNWKGGIRKSRKGTGVYSAYAKVRNAKANGMIKSEPCKVCGNNCTEAHHKDYSKPLEVVWLCKRHHNLVDRHKIVI